MTCQLASAARGGHPWVAACLGVHVQRVAKPSGLWTAHSVLQPADTYFPPNTCAAALSKQI